MGKKRGAKSATEFVLDCSVTMAWYFEDEANAYAKSVLQSLDATSAVVPSIWQLEVANVLLIGERRGRSSEAGAVKRLANLLSLPIRIDDQTTARAWSDMLHIARSYGVSAYDASYLELAIRLGLPLTSLDRNLKAAAESAGVPLFDPAANG